LRVPRVANSFSRYVPVFDPRFSYRGDVLPKFLQMPIGYTGLRRIRGIGLLLSGLITAGQGVERTIRWQEPIS